MSFESSAQQQQQQRRRPDSLGFAELEADDVVHLAAVGRVVVLGPLAHQHLAVLLSSHVDDVDLPHRTCRGNKKHASSNAPQREEHDRCLSQADARPKNQFGKHVGLKKAVPVSFACFALKTAKRCQLIHLEQWTVLWLVLRIQIVQHLAAGITLQPTHIGSSTSAAPMCATNLRTQTLLKYCACFEKFRVFCFARRTDVVLDVLHGEVGRRDAQVEPVLTVDEDRHGEARLLEQLHVHLVASLPQHRDLIRPASRGAAREPSANTCSCNTHVFGPQNKDQQGAPSWKKSLHCMVSVVQKRCKCWVK